MSSESPRQIKASRAGSGIHNTQEECAFDSVVAAVDQSREWRCYDRFGADLRRFLQQAPIDISCEEVEQLVLMHRSWGRSVAERMALQMYQQQVQSWAEAYRASFNQPPASPETEKM